MAQRAVIQGTDGQIHIREHPDETARRAKRDAAKRPTAGTEAKLDYIIDLLEVITAKLGG